MNKKVTFNIWYVFLAMWGVLLLQTLWTREQNPVERIPYSQFLTYLSEGRIEEVQIAPNYIEGTLNSPFGHFEAGFANYHGAGILSAEFTDGEETWASTRRLRNG
jgi:ATP-dependent Zn protease